VRAVLLAVLIGVTAAFAAAVMPHPIRLGGVGVGDIGLPLAGIAQFEAGGSPYELRLRGHSHPYYPFTTMVALWPLTLVPLRLAVPLFVGVSSAALAYAIARKGRPWQLLIFLTPPYWSAVQSVQWSPLLTAAILLPPLLPLALVKPQLSVVLAASGRWSRWTLIATAAFGLLSLAIWPVWPLVWLRQGNLRTFTGMSPVTVLPGVVLLLAALAWRAREGRLLLAMSLIVQRYFYDQLPLYLVARTWRQMVLLLVTSWLMVGVLWRWKLLDTMAGVQHLTVWRALVIAVFLPALAVVLFNRRADAQQLARVHDVVAGGHLDQPSQ
jgi:hypothetical protein